VIALAAGFVLDLTVRVDGRAAHGQTYVILELVRGLDGPLTLVGTFASGYVTASQGVGWPGSPIISSTDGEPAVRYVQGTDPRPAEITETVPTGARWEVMTLIGDSHERSDRRERGSRSWSFRPRRDVVAPQSAPSGRRERRRTCRAWCLGPGIQQQTAGLLGALTSDSSIRFSCSRGVALDVDDQLRQVGDAGTPTSRMSCASGLR
jgi:hypothetical protein